MMILNMCDSRGETGCVLVRQRLIILKSNHQRCSAHPNDFKRTQRNTAVRRTTFTRRPNLWTSIREALRPISITDTRCVAVAWRFAASDSNYSGMNLKRDI